ncbi:MAG: 30S ribosomal protein S1 [Deltaproteobacteria bacterium]|jgi:small subunit ribosomal protein S1|nr:30S ribosomal protein S1 [Deltaproteobacteria bacterium]
MENSSNNHDTDLTATVAEGAGTEAAGAAPEAPAPYPAQEAAAAPAPAEIPEDAAPDAAAPADPAPAHEESPVAAADPAPAPADAAPPDAAPPADDAAAPADSAPAPAEASEEAVSPDAPADAEEGPPDNAADPDFDSAEPDAESMKRFYEESFRSLTEGEVLQGVVVQIGKEYVMVDVHSKSEGRINLREFQDENGVPQVKIGDTVEALLVKRGDDDGDMILSKDKATRQKLWDDLTRIHGEGGEIEGVVTGKVKGGLNVDINGIQAFLPGSQLDIKQVKSMEPYIGKPFRFLIIKMNRRRSNVVLSRRAVQQKEIDEKRSHTLSVLEEGAIVEGVVKNLTSYGAFVDLGGLDGLLHVTDVTWGRIGRLEDHLKVGDKIKVKVLSFDRNKQKVSLGIKQLHEDPWTSAVKTLEVGQKVQGKVVSLTEYGAFVEICPGVEGLIHISEMSWTRKVRNPATVLKVGDIVECVIQSINNEGKRISLSMKQVEPNPWTTVAERYPIGTIIEGKIKSITDFGVFIGIDEGIDGLVHISDISWNRRNRHPSEIYKKGDSVRALILAIDTEQERFSLGVKQLEDDPWQTAELNYAVGSSVTGKVSSITEFGVFIEIQDGIDGLLHSSQANLPKGKPLAEAFHIGDEVTAKVNYISPQEHKIGLTLRPSGKEDSDEAPRQFGEREGGRGHRDRDRDRGDFSTKDLGGSSSFGSGAFGDLDKLLAQKNKDDSSTEEES